MPRDFNVGLRRVLAAFWCFVSHNYETATYVYMGNAVEGNLCWGYLRVSFLHRLSFGRVIFRRRYVPASKVPTAYVTGMSSWDSNIRMCPGISK